MFQIQCQVLFDCLHVENSVWERWPAAWRNAKAQMIHLFFPQSIFNSYPAKCQTCIQAYLFECMQWLKHLFLVTACMVSTHTVIIKELHLCLCTVIIINSLCLSSWSRQPRCWKENGGDARCMNSAEARSSLSWLQASRFSSWNHRWISEKTNLLNYLKALLVPVTGSHLRCLSAVSRNAPNLRSKFSTPLLKLLETLIIYNIVDLGLS